MKKIFMAGAAILLAASTAVSAATLTITGGEFKTIPGYDGDQPETAENNVLDTLFGGDITLGGYAGATIGLTGDSPLLVEVFGWEAGYFNSFTIDGTTVERAATDPTFLVGNPLQSFITSSLSSGVLTFSFDSIGYDGITPEGGVANGSNTVSGMNFFASFASYNPGDGSWSNEQDRSGTALWLFYDDMGLPGDNHDDFAVRVSVVPLPAGVLLLLTGLGGFALFRRRKTAIA
jgi:hypothetical protein